MKHLSEMKVLGLAGIIVFLFCSSAIASLSGGISLQYFGPTYGEVNDDLESVNERLGTNWELESGLAWGLNLNYDFSPNWRMRGEYFSFSSKTSDSYSGLVPYTDVDVDIDYEVEANLAALILSGIYRFSPDKAFCPYAGLGIGLFSTELKTKTKGEGSYYDYYQDWAGDVNESQSDDASPIGFQFLGGAEYKAGKNLSIVGELRYISAKAEGLFEGEGYSTVSPGEDVDWSGLSFGLGITYTFK